MTRYERTHSCFRPKNIPFDFFQKIVDLDDIVFLQEKQSNKSNSLFRMGGPFRKCREPMEEFI